ncbi:transcription termination factor MTERF5, chloroplastic-like protein [Tanacetum coccineum]|uniref:Transcription termination factor MTERF5, chloroplastic-like protein n=1 Tax=Tanacetum coccineum TaxID=301880 RepID=A0ABQ5FL24_9ASTR
MKKKLGDCMCDMTKKKKGRVLRKYGVSSHKIESLLLKNPGCLLQRVEWLDGVVKKVEPLLGIRPDSPRFLDGVEIVKSFSEATLNKKLGIFRSFGWTEDEIVRMTGSLPSCLRRSEGTIKASLEWFKEKPSSDAFALLKVQTPVTTRSVDDCFTNTMEIEIEGLETAHLC